MPFPSPHIRVTFFGDAWSSQEEWSTGLRIDGTVLPTVAQLQALEVAFSALFRDAALKTSSSVRFWGVKAAPQTVDGLYGDNGQAVEYLRPTPNFNAFAGGLPQASIAATLTTGMLRGLANEGRMYLPATAWTPEADGRLSVAQTQAIVGAMTTFINAVNDVGIGRVTIFSKGSEVPGATGAGAKRVVTGVRVGRVIDTQRRRRNQISEEYLTGVVDPL